jgi:hypothetical protein
MSELSPFKDKQNNTEDLRDAASMMGQRSQLHGQELETWLRRDIAGVINGYKGYDMFRPDLPSKIPTEQKSFITRNGALLKSDLVIYGNPLVPPACIIESKGTINENWYSIMWFAERYTNRNIPYVVITKDTKQVLKTGKTDYLKHAENLNMKIFVNTHDNYDNIDNKIFWEDYVWNDMVRPYYEFSTYIATLVKQHFNQNVKHKFFEFETETK